MSRRGGLQQSSIPSNSAILYIGALPFEWTENNLKSVVCGTGNVLDVRLGFDHIGKNKGFAFVEYQSPQEAQHAAFLLGQVQIVAPGMKNPKRLRIELSKEGFRTGNNEFKNIIPFDPSHLPPTVNLPSEVLMKYGLAAPLADFQRNLTPSSLALLPPAPVNLAPQQKFQRQQAQQMLQFNQPQQFQAQQTQLPQQSAISDQFLRASAMLPQSTQLPFSKPDNINETLGSIPPAQLIELIANLKNILISPQAGRAADVFQISPNLAVAVSQALLLMGFIDEDVILESMKSASVTPQIPNIGQGLPPQPQLGLQYPAYNGTSGFQNNSPIPPPVNTMPQSQQQPLKWANLPLSTQMKLGNMPPDQAELIAQVLSLPPDQINSLPPDRQTMIASIRQQYL